MHRGNAQFVKGRTRLHKQSDINSAQLHSKYSKCSITHHVLNTTLLLANRSIVKVITLLLANFCNPYKVCTTIVHLYSSGEAAVECSKADSLCYLGEIQR